MKMIGLLKDAFPDTAFHFLFCSLHKDYHLIINKPEVKVFFLSSCGKEYSLDTFVNCGHLKNFLLLPDLKIW